jgi:hypothetical protein
MDFRTLTLALPFALMLGLSANADNTGGSGPDGELQPQQPAVQQQQCQGPTDAYGNCQQQQQGFGPQGYGQQGFGGQPIGPAGFAGGFAGGGFANGPILPPPFQIQVIAFFPNYPRDQFYPCIPGMPYLCTMPVGGQQVFLVVVGGANYWRCNDVLWNNGGWVRPPQPLPPLVGNPGWGPGIGGPVGPGGPGGPIVGNPGWGNGGGGRLPLPGWNNGGGRPTPYGYGNRRATYGLR